MNRRANLAEMEAKEGTDGSQVNLTFRHANWEKERLKDLGQGRKYDVIGILTGTRSCIITYRAPSVCRKVSGGRHTFLLMDFCCSERLLVSDTSPSTDYHARQD